MKKTGPDMVFAVAVAAGLLAMPVVCCAASGVDCSFDVVYVTQNQETAYDPFEFAALRIPQSIQVRNNGSKTCDAIIAFLQMGRADMQGPSGQALAYSIETSRGTSSLPPGLALQPESNAISTAAGVAPGGTRSLSYYVTVRPGQTVYPGAYAGTLGVAVYSVATGARIAGAPASATLPIQVAVKSVLSVNIAGAGQTATLDFGVLATGATRNVTIQARTNQRYRLSAASSGKGALKLDPSSPDGVAWQVPYTVKLDAGADVALAMPRGLSISGSTTPLTGRNVPLEVKIGEVSGQRAGRYRDVITVTIDAVP